MKASSVIAIALFGGSGTRFGAPIPKQFVLVEGKPMMVWTLEALASSPLIEEILVVAKSDTIEQTKNAIQQANLEKIYDVIPGGNSREESVWNALSYLKEAKTKEDCIVLIQDGDRPALSPRLMEENILAAKGCGAAVTALPSADSLLLAEEGEVKNYLPRSLAYRVQTPQTFRFGIAFAAFEEAAKKNLLPLYTDDASIVKDAGNRVKIVLGENSNIKLTTPEDLALLSKRRKEE